MAIDLERIRMVDAAIVRPVDGPGIHRLSISPDLQLCGPGSSAQEVAQRNGALARGTGQDGSALILHEPADNPVSEDTVGHPAGQIPDFTIAEAGRLILAARSSLDRRTWPHALR